MTVKHDCKTVEGVRTWYFSGYDDKNILDAPYRAVESLRRLLYGSQHVEGTPGDLAKGQTKKGDRIEFVFLESTPTREFCKNATSLFLPVSWANEVKRVGMRGQRLSSCGQMIVDMVDHRY
jgi:hypothetical protein